MQSSHFDGCRSIMWYDQYCENFYPKGFKHYTPEAVLADLDTINADIVALYATNQWGMAYYPSQVVPCSIGLDGRDYFGEVLAGLKARGKKVIAYINWLDSRHPEWRCVPLTPQGLNPPTAQLEAIPYYEPQGLGEVYKVKYGEWFTHCIASPRCDEVLALTREIVTRYPAIDGFHMDMFFNYAICGCDLCQPKLRELTGSDQPTYEAVMAHWSEYLLWRQEISTATIAQMANIVRQAGKAFAPNSFCPLYLTPSMAVSPSWWQYQDFYVTEAWLRLSAGYADLHSTTLVSKWLRAIDKPSALLVTGQHPNYSHAPLALEEFRLHAAGCLANGTPVLGSCGQGAYPSTASSPAAVRIIGQAFGEYAQAMDTLPARESAAQIAVLWSQDSRDFYEPGAQSLKYRFEFLGYCRALLEGHYLFDIILPEKLLSPDDLARYRAVILPNAACMDESTAEILRAYVALGGKLVSTWDTACRDKHGAVRANSLLADVLGLTFKGSYPLETVYAERTPEPCVVNGGAAITEADSAVTLLCLVEPDPDYPEVGTNTDLMPGPISAYPFLTVNRYQDGQAWYVAGSLGYSLYKHGFYQVNEMMAGLFTHMGLPRAFCVEAPCTVEFNAERDAQGGWYLHLGNLTVPAYHPGTQTNRAIDCFIPVHDIKLQLPFSVQASQVSASNGNVSISEGEQGSVLMLAPLKDYCIVRIAAGA